jgi:hypothetical protein
MTHELPSSQTLDLYERVACLSELTGQGKDISINLDMIKVIVRWLNLLSAEWVRACSKGSTGQRRIASDEKKGTAELSGSGTGLGLGFSGMQEEIERGRSSQAAKEIPPKEEVGSFNGAIHCLSADILYHREPTTWRHPNTRSRP